MPERPLKCPFVHWTNRMSIGHSDVHLSIGQTEMSIGHSKSIGPLDKKRCLLDIQMYEWTLPDDKHSSLLSTWGHPQ